MKQPGLFGLSDHFSRLSVNGDPLEELARIVDFEGFRVILGSAWAYSMVRRPEAPPMTTLQSSASLFWWCRTM